jgi:hypothetical protein
VRPLARLALLLFLPVVVTACSILGTSSPPSPYCRPGNPLAGVYHPARLKVKRRCKVVTGTVTRVKFEDYDGDVHVDLELDSAENVVVEVIPQDRSRVAIPEVSSRVSVAGPWVRDEQHGWMEIHPAWWISSGRLVPATPTELRRAQLLLAGAASEPDTTEGRPPQRRPS